MVAKHNTIKNCLFMKVIGGVMSKIKFVDYFNISIALLIAIPVKIIIHLFKAAKVFLIEQKNFYTEVVKDYKEI
jgi:hypothetical protein